MDSRITHLSQFVGTGECSTETGIRFAMLVVDANGDSTGNTTSQVSDASACTTRSINEQWYTSGIRSGLELSMMRALRRGDAGVLNAYFKAIPGSVIGYASGITGYVKSRFFDGVVVRDTTIVGGSSASYNEGVSRFEQK
jgi:hypothetical protein